MLIHVYGGVKTETGLNSTVLVPCHAAVHRSSLQEEGGQCPKEV